MHRFFIIATLLTIAFSGCSSVEKRRPVSRRPAPTMAAVPLPGPTERASLPLSGELREAIEDRLAALKRTGGVCSRYAAVLESSYREGRITLRPYMWRVRGRLASGQATPDGEITLARHIDSLNVGVRTVDDVIWSMEHEAAHIALRIASRELSQADPADDYVRGCRRPASAG